MGEILTVKEIHKRFPDEWVLLEDPVVAKDLRVIRGRVVFHSPDIDAFDRKTIELRLKHFARLYTGKIAANMAIVL